MIEYEFSIKHRGCWTEHFNRDYPALSPTIVYSHAFADRSSTLIEIEEIDGEVLDSVLTWFTDQPVIESHQLFDYQSDDALALIRLHTDFSQSDSMPVRKVYRENDCFPIATSSVRNGREHATVIAPSEKRAQQTHEDLTRIGDVTVKSLTHLNIDCSIGELAEINHVIRSLSPRQKEVLVMAIQEGYYDSPRTCNVDELADIDSASMSTVAEHLRLGEAKVLKAIKPLLKTPP